MGNFALFQLCAYRTVTDQEVQIIEAWATDNEDEPIELVAFASKTAAAHEVTADAQIATADEEMGAPVDETGSVSEDMASTNMIAIGPSRSFSALSGRTRAKAWSTEEDKLCVHYMRQVVDKPDYKSTEERFETVARLLSSHHGVDRSPAAVKMMWTSRLRAVSGVEDRGKNRRSERMVTSALGSIKGAARDGVTNTS